MKNPLSVSQSSRLLRWSAIFLGIIAFLALVSWLTVPSYLKNTLQQQVEAQTGRKFELGDVSFNPFTLTVNLSQIRFMEADKKTAAFSADNLMIKASLMSVFHAAPVIRAVELRHPKLQLVLSSANGKDVSNFSDVIEHLAQHPGKGDPLRFSVSNIQLSDGAIEFDDRIAGKLVHIDALTLNLPYLSDFSAATDVYVEPYLSALVDGSKLELKGRSKPFSATLDTDVAIDINQFNLTELLPFYPKPLPFKVKSALLSTHLNLNFSELKNAKRISLSGTANVNELKLEDKSGAPLYASKQISLTVQDANLVDEHIALKSMEIIEPQIWLGFDQQGELNWLSGQPAAVAEVPAPEAARSKPLQIDLAHFQIKNGAVHWSDAAHASPALQMLIPNIAVDARQLSTSDKAEPAKVTLSFGAQDKQQLHFEGRVKPASVSGELILNDVALEDYQPYLNQVLATNMAGKLELHTQVELIDGKFSLSALSGSLENLNMQAVKREFGGLSAKKIAVQNFSMNGATRQIKLEQLILDQVQGDVFRTSDGAVNVTRFMQKVAAAGPAKSADANVQPAWQSVVDQITLNDSQFTFGDKAVQPNVLVQADGVNIKLEHVTGDLLQPVKLQMRAVLNKTGKFSVDGAVSQKSMALNVDVQNFAIKTLQPYFTQFLNIDLEKGNVSTTGQAGWQAPGEVTYQGSLKLANFITSDKATSDDFLKWGLLEISGINLDVGGSQPRITLGKINLSDFYARAILSDQGKLNLRDVIAHTETATDANGVAAATATAPTEIAARPAQPATPRAIISVGEINLSNGIVNYTDNFIKPNYSMRMTGMKGKVGALRSDVPQSAAIDINGKVDDEAPIVISGSLNPLFNPMLLDIKMTATEVDLPKLTTYALKYAGYPIIKGKLSLDVEYHIKDNQLTANNSLKLDQLTFGDKVDGPDATHLPVPFLISLLTDSNGQINLDLPISGTINDPQFSVGGLIMEVLVNVLEKVITSPFSLLAHVFGSDSGDELAYIEFDPGLSKLTPAAKEKLDKLAQALAQRPQLKMDMTGRADMTTDAAGLRAHILDRQIKRSQNMEEEASNDVVMTDAERAIAVEKIYSAAKFDKPRNVIGIAKSLPTAEMEKLLIANTKVSDDDIRALALRRESVVHTYLIDTAHVAPDRLFSIAPKLSGEGIKDNGAISRVDFELKM
ncbi:uncharacterized protein involved in outer membrane biogenesis [Oxalobacteraceae bacterium GrIS 2.11]